MIKKYKDIRRIGDVVFYSADEVFKKWQKSKRFQKAYNEEMARLKLARQIKESRLARRLTQKVLAERAGMPQSVIARMESGNHSFSLGTLYRVSKVLKKEIQLV